MALSIAEGLNTWDPIRLYTDSLSLLQAMASTQPGDPLVWVLREKCLDLMTTRNLRLYWVKAHVGVMGNEVADRYAKEATARPAVDMELLRTTSDFQREARAELLSLWQTRWVQSETGRQTAQFFPLVDLVPKLHNSNTMQIITGHGRFPHYFKRFNISDTDICGCGSLGDANHYITDCRYTSDLRSKLRFDPDYPPSLFEAVTNLPILNDIVARVAGLLPNF
ncbi:hypothetical protein AVEN_82685-1 [Araneus ventricosus]|uniref:RNase H type-1 domain-containing protein n=1 Tax=Araneus ventricosus TaxID=182803 RepID=A0A4Y2WYA2_ARAVE|nr:hypothetical protein AVEN_245142-1 [Araneus ventricosus]GBO41490.1 hypothetical protein AVEN_82685-1 [Araneus ventricosus]